ncbi:MAG: amino acid adenylation domain-containing protein [Pseudomonadota bacterium]|nr:amino acid adenylation domain-containing protein [Pseudomonadota bacterium]
MTVQNLGRSGLSPLTVAQSGIWFAQTRSSSASTFNTGQVLWIDGPLDREALVAAVTRVASEADALAMRFGKGADGTPGYGFGDAPSLTVRDVPNREAAEQGIAEEALIGFDLEHGPVARFTLWRVSETCHALSQHMHHIVADGYANTLITRRIAGLYAHAKGQGPEPGALGQHAASQEADRAYAGSDRQAADRAWWAEALAGFDGAGGFRRGPAVATGHFHRAETLSDADLMADLRGLGDRAGINWADCITALTAAYAARLTEGESAPGIPLMNRTRGGLGSVISTQVNIVPLRHPVDEDAPLIDWLAGCGAALADIRRHGFYRGEALRRDLHLIGGDRRLHGPLINVLPFDPTPRLPGLETRLDITGAGSVDDATFAFRGDGRGPLLMQVDVNPSLYEPADATAHLARLETFLRNACTTERLADVPTLTEAEHRTHVVTRCATDHPVPETTLAALIEAQMQATPDAPALIYDRKVMDFATLNRRSAALAATLRRRGAGPGERVAVALPRSFDLLVALVAVIRSGAAYVPLDPEDHSDRRADMLSRATPCLVLADDAFPAPNVLPPQLWPEAAEALEVSCQPTDSAYVLFTSGSTGRPKGVQVSHRAIVNRLLWMQSEYGIGPDDRILQKTPATFDVSVWEFFLPLISGASLVIAPPGAHRDPVKVAHLIRDNAVSAVHFVPSMLAMFVDAKESAGLVVRHIFASGEALPTDLAQRCLAHLKTRLHNLYGPTEASVDVTSHEATGRELTASVPIGGPVWNTRTYVLDARHRPVPDGVAGQLFLAGRQLADGYFAQPDLTAARFVPDPFHPGERMYDTGDIVFAQSDGTLVYEGRADGQVKIRGVRIETGDIEAAIMATGRVSQAVVRALPDTDHGARLVAWVTPELDVEPLSAELATRLPAAMQPAAIVPMAAFPLGATGKLDARALPAPTLATASRVAAPGLETDLATLFAEVLDLPEPAGAEVDFFRAGGDSLRAVRLTLLIEERLGRQCGLGDLFDAPVLADLARRIETAETAMAGTAPILRLSQGTKPPLFAIHPAGGIGWCYRGLAGTLDDRPIITLQSPLLDPNAPAPESLSALADDYAARILETVRDGPIHLAGWSLGGLIAQDVAVHLRSAGHQTGLVALLDSYPSACWRDQPEPGPDMALKALLAIAGHDPDAHPELERRDQILGFLRDHDDPLAQLPEAILDGVIRSVQHTNRLVRGHREHRYDGALLHIRAANDHQGTELSADLWAPYTTRLDRVDLPCLHGELLNPRVRADLCAALNRQMSLYEAG